ncbi:MAG: hypothetical protein KF782_32210 [Labilithrix sp.]|nr:hypothetical protein [Labilithrix sp.]
MPADYEILAGAEPTPRGSVASGGARLRSSSTNQPTRDGAPSLAEVRDMLTFSRGATMRRSLLAACVLAGCGGKPPAEAPHPGPSAQVEAAAAPDPEVHVRFAHVAPERFRAEYRLRAPAAALAFRRSPPRVRERWRAEGARIVRSGDVDFVVMSPPASSLAIDIEVDAVEPDKEYRFAFPYSDHGVLAYTGHLAVGPARCVDAACTRLESEREAPLSGTIALVPGPDEEVVPRDAILPMATDGTYVYFGPQTPTETPDFIGVVDPGFPPWLKARLDGLLPKLFAFYREALGPRSKPRFYVTFERREGARTIAGGVVPPGVIQFGVALGSEYLGGKDDVLAAEIDRLVAHEVAHLWNTDRYNHTGARGTAWLYEGAADAFAYRLLRAIGRIDDATYHGYLSQAASLCAIALSGGEPLHALARPGYNRAFYDCGSTIALVSEAALKLSSPSAKQDLFTLWRAVFSKTNAEGEYDPELYLAVLGGWSARTRPAVDVIRRLTNDPQPDIGAELPRLLADFGIDARPSASLPPDYEVRVSPAAVRALLPAVCVEGLAIDGNRSVRPVVKTEGACGAQKDDVFESIEGVDLAKRGATAFDAGYAACTKRRAITVGRRGKPSVTIPCAESPRPRPPFIQVTKTP